ncbi:MAG TPA: PEP-utilizing enzyme [Actinomycetota bacterium]|jgi:pyruvate,water dikinase|nr:PEP-utilizing enzyme [Actinomycetota bacterium]
MPFELRWDDPADATYVWNRYMGGPVTRFYEDAVAAMYVAKRRCYEETGVPNSRGHLFRVIDGWVFNREPGDLTGADERAERFRNDAMAVEGDYYEVVLRPEVVALVERLRKHPKPTAPYPELITHLEECVQAHARVMGDLHWRMTFSWERLDWPATFHELTGEPAGQASVLLSGARTELSKVIKRLCALAEIAQSDEALRHAVETRDVRKLRGHPDNATFRKFRTSFRTLLRRYGQRTGQGWGSAAPMGAPTWNMRPDIPLGMIATYARSDLSAFKTREKAAADERQRLLQRVQRSMRNDPERRSRFERARRRAIRTAHVMEDHNHWMDQCSAGIMREALDVVGKRLVLDGRIDSADDAMHVSLDELRTPPDDLRTRISDRARRFAEQETFDPPKKIGSGDAPKQPSLEDEGQGLDGSLLRGVAASAGRYTGRARVWPKIVDTPEVDDGDILVAPDAGPAWTPVFAVLGALVLDRGASFQHAAVVAREYGIPAVLGTQEATTAIRDGQTITVDGNTGVVELA